MFGLSEPSHPKPQPPEPRIERHRQQAEQATTPSSQDEGSLEQGLVFETGFRVQGLGLTA